MSYWSLHPVQLLTFDLDDTLWPCMPVIQAAERAVHDWFREAVPVIAECYDIDSLREHRIRVARENPYRAHDLTGIRLHGYRHLTRRHGLDEAIAEQANAIFRRERNKVTPWPEVAEALHTLREYFVLVAVSNGNAQIEHTPLADCFHQAFMAEEVGAAKPDPALFHAAADVSGIPLSRAVHVGDDPHRDVEAARRMGMQTVWVNRNGMVWPEDLPPPDHTVSDLCALVALLLDDH